MISYIRGKVLAKGPDYIIAEAGGVGYKVIVAEGSLASFAVGKEAELYCYLHFKREETLELYGTESREALDVFEAVINISGIGPRAALNIASLGTMEQLREAVNKGSEDYFSRVHGIGKKKIQKIILELTGKLKALHDTKGPEQKDVVDALVALGFARNRARQAVSELPEHLSSTEEKVKEALKHIRP